MASAARSSSNVGGFAAPRNRAIHCPMKGAAVRAPLRSPQSWRRRVRALVPRYVIWPASSRGWSGARNRRRATGGGARRRTSTCPGAHDASHGDSSGAPTPSHASRREISYHPKLDPCPPPGTAIQRSPSPLVPCIPTPQESLETYGVHSGCTTERVSPSVQPDLDW